VAFFYVDLKVLNPFPRLCHHQYCVAADGAHVELIGAVREDTNRPSRRR